MAKKQSTRIDLLDRASFFSISIHAWRNRRKVRIDAKTDADPRWLGHSKKLIESEEYDALLRAQGEVKQAVLRRAMPSFVQKGVTIVKLAEVSAVEKIIREGIRDIEKNELPNFLRVYQQRVEEAREPLGDQWKESDYPPVDVVRAQFRIDWQWLYLGVPDNLPDGLKQKEVEKLQKTFAEAQEQIVAALRKSFSDLVTHAVERLEPGPRGKTKTFRDTLVENFTEFFETFEARNLMNDDELADVVAKAKELLTNVDADELRDDKKLRAKVADGFSQVKAVVDQLVIERPGRKFGEDED